jgi:dTDP-L-rhamnose 4-epimerase
LSEHILITGGAGFIGSHLADRLLAAGHRVRVLDCLLPQVHGEGKRRPTYLDSEVELQVGDVRDPQAIRQALKGVDRVFHLAAAVGVGQSMYEPVHYTEVNDLGTAVLMQALMEHPVKRLVVASSMSLYGEGEYQNASGERVQAPERSLEQLRARRWDPVGPDGAPLTPLPTPEDKRPALPSVYALGKYVQERLCLTMGRAYDIPTVALRFFNVYGTRQALSNPYTGVLAIFASRYLNGKSPLINEDGHQQRDFVHVSDVTRACVAAMQSERAVGEVLNVGSGSRQSVLEVAASLAKVMGREHVRPEVTGRYRMGDIRHCFADISRAEALLDWQPRVGFEEGLGELAGWLADQRAEDRSDEAQAHLMERGLSV